MYLSFLNLCVFVRDMDIINNVYDYFLGPGLISQLLLTIVLLIVFYTVVTALESIVGTFTKLDRNSTVLFDATTPDQQVIPQNPSASSLIYNSENEVHGMEFSYSMYLFINPQTFEQSVSAGTCGNGSSSNTNALKHIFHRGTKEGFPLMAPGLFVEGSKNTLRLYMNSSTKWDNYVEIPNTPIGKWFHLVIVQKGKYLDVFINGNIVVRHEFITVPKLNYGNVYVLYPVKFPKAGSDTSVAPNFIVDGAAKGMVSRLNYFAYALGYSQIDSLYREGPSKKIVSNSYTEIPPYFNDSWWVTKY